MQRNDIGPTESSEHLYPNVTQSTRADHDHSFPRKKMAGGLLCYVICRQARVGMRRNIFRGKSLGQLNQRTCPGSQKFRIATISVDTRKLAAFDLHIIATSCDQRVAIGDQGMADYWIALFKALNSLSDLFHPSRIFVAHHVW